MQGSGAGLRRWHQVGEATLTHGAPGLWQQLCPENQATGATLHSGHRPLTLCPLGSGSFWALLLAQGQAEIPEKIKWHQNSNVTDTLKQILHSGM